MSDEVERLKRERELTKDPFSRIAFNYRKLKQRYHELGLLSQQALNEKEAVLNEAVHAAQRLRQAVNENENLKFRNGQLLCRVSVLQEENEMLRRRFPSRVPSASFKGRSVVSHRGQIPSESSSSYPVEEEEEALAKNSGFLDSSSQVTTESVAADVIEETNRQIVRLVQENDHLKAEIHSIKRQHAKELEVKEAQLADFFSTLNAYRRQTASSVSTKDTQSLESNLVAGSKIVSLFGCVDTFSPKISPDVTADAVPDCFTNLHALPCRVPCSKLRSNGHNVVKFLECMVSVARELYNEIVRLSGNDVIVSEKGSSSGASQLVHYELSSVAALLQLSQSEIDDYSTLPPFMQNRFWLMQITLKRCKSALTIARRLVDLLRNYRLVSDAEGVSVIRALQVYQHTSQELEANFKALSLISPSERGGGDWNHTAAVILQHIAAVTKRFSTEAETIPSTESVVWKWNGSPQLLDASHLLTLVVKSERELLVSHGWHPCTMHTAVAQNSLPLRGFPTNLFILNHNYDKMTRFLTRANDSIRMRHFETALEQQSLSGTTNTQHIETLQECYRHLQEELVATNKKLDDSNNFNEMLGFKIKALAISQKGLHQVPSDEDDKQPELLQSVNNKLAKSIRDYFQERIAYFQTEHRKTLSYIYLILSDWRSMRQLLDEYKQKYKEASNDAVKYKNEHASLASHLASTKKAYESNVTELTEELSILRSTVRRLKIQ